MDYWEKLQKSKIYSQERRRERYMVIFLWKISQGLVNGYDVLFTSPSRRGRTAMPHEIVMSAPARVRIARETQICFENYKIMVLSHIAGFPSHNIICCSLSFLGFWIHACEYRKYLDLNGVQDISG